MASAIVGGGNQPPIANRPTVAGIGEIDCLEITFRSNFLTLPRLATIVCMNNRSLFTDEPAAFGICEVQICEVNFPIGFAGHILPTTDKQCYECKRKRYRSKYMIGMSLSSDFFLLKMSWRS